MMTIAQLAANFRLEERDDGLLSLAAGSLPPGLVADFVSLLPSGILPMIDVSVLNDATELRIEGQLKGTWHVPGFDGLLINGPKITIELTAPTAVAPPSLSTLSVTGETVWLETLFSLKGVLNENGQLALNALPHSGQRYSLSHVGATLWSSRGDDILPPGVVQMFPGSGGTLRSFALYFSPSSSANTRIEVVQNLPDWNPLPQEDDQFAMKQAGIGLSTDYDPFAGAYAYGHILLAELSFAGCALDIVLDCRSDSHWRMLVVPLDKQTLPTLDIFVPWLGKGPAWDEVRNALSAAGCFSEKIVLERVEIGFDIAAREVDFVSFSADMTVQGAQINLSSTLYPAFDLGISYPPEMLGNAVVPGIPLNQWLNEVYEPVSGFLPSTEIDAFSMYAAPSMGLYQFNVDVSGAWKFDMGGQSLSIAGLALSLQKLRGALTGQICGSGRIADLDFILSVTRQGRGEWLLAGQAAMTKPLILAHFFVRFLTWLGVDVPVGVHTPRVKLAALYMRYDTAANSFGFNATSDTAMEFPIINGVSLPLDLNVSVQYAPQEGGGKRVLSGNLTAQAAVAGELFDFEYQLGQDTSIVTLQWAGNGKSLHLEQILRAFGFGNNSIFQLPDWLNAQLRLESAFLQINILEDTLTLMATLGAGEQIFVQIGKVVDTNISKTTYTGVLGLALPNGVQFDQLPIVSMEFPSLKMLDFLDIDYACILYASAPVLGFAPPTVAGQPNAFAAIGTVLQSLPQGASMSFSIDFASSSNPIVQNMTKVMPLSTVVCQIALTEGAPQFALTGQMFGEIEVGSGSDSLGIKDAMLSITVRPDNQQEPLQFQFEGDVQVAIGSDTLYARVRLAFDESDANASFMLREALTGSDKPVSLVAPMGIKGIALNDIGGEIGVHFTVPEAVTMGLEGSFTIGGQSHGSDKFAFVVAFVDEVPDPVFLHVAFADLGMGVIVDACLDTNAGIPAFLYDIALKQVSLYWCETATMLPDGTMTQPGFGCNGLLQIGDFSLFGSLKISQTQGISGVAQMSPVQMPGLVISGKGAGVPAKNIQPHGPALQFHTLSSPTLSASLGVSLFNLVDQQVIANVGASGMQFDLQYTIASVASFALACTVQNTAYFSGAASFDFGLQHTFSTNILGIYPVDFNVDATFHTKLALTIDGTFQLLIDGTFDFEGLTLTLPQITKDEKFTDITSLPGVIITQIENNVEQVFAELIPKLEDIFTAGAKTVAAIERQTANTLTTIAFDAQTAANQIIAEAQTLANEVGSNTGIEAAAITAATAALSASAKAEIDRIKADADQIAAGLQAQAQLITDLANGDVTRIARDAMDDVDRIRNAMYTAMEQTSQTIEEATSHAEQVMRGIVADTEEIVGNIIGLSQRDIDAIRAATEEIWHVIDLVEDALKNVFHTVVDTIEGIANDIWDGIEDVFSC